MLGLPALLFPVVYLSVIPVPRDIEPSTPVFFPAVYAFADPSSALALSTARAGGTRRWERRRRPARRAQLAGRHDDYDCDYERPFKAAW